ncbi:high potential iron-sulfur protein [Freshwater phage uvFW-CGR-AMD-COM-C203]|nr:high potential iron-sulfur protein [Freshwater phage uvFW-CGR-AMD-COM-C203]
MSLTPAVSALLKASCPTATQDVRVNLKNRKKAIDDASYGPLNPSEANKAYWDKIAEEWSVSPEEAKKQRCGNCAAFIQTSAMKECITGGLAQGDTRETAWDVTDAGELGYCEAFDFKCASERTCRAWIVGGPITDKNKK